MDRTEKEDAFLEDLKKIMIKHKVCTLMVGDGQGMICSLVKDNYFSSEEASIYFDIS